MLKTLHANAHIPAHIPHTLLATCTVLIVVPLYALGCMPLVVSNAVLVVVYNLCRQLRSYYLYAVTIYRKMLDRTLSYSAGS